jgi:hypothetical protein
MVKNMVEVSPRHLQGISKEFSCPQDLLPASKPKDTPTKESLRCLRCQGNTAARSSGLRWAQNPLSRRVECPWWQLMATYGNTWKPETDGNWPKYAPNIPKSSQATGLAVSQIASKIDKWLNLWSRYFVYLMCCENSFVTTFRDPHVAHLEDPLAKWCSPGCHRSSLLYTILASLHRLVHIMGFHSFHNKYQ